MKKIHIGISVAFLSAISDILLLYHPQLIEKYDKYQFLFEIDTTANTIGWLMGMIFLPMLYIGYKGVKEISDEYSNASLEKADWVVVFLIALGCVVHSSYHFLPLMHQKNTAVSELEIVTIKTIEILFVSFYILFCTMISFQSLQVRNVLLYANRYFNPLFWMVFVAIVFMVTPTYGGYLAVSAFNMSIGFYFIGVLVNSKKVKRI